jgi:hypothetical protein
MILHVAVDFKALICLGRHYPWKRPQSCPGCHRGLWGHGWVTVYLEGVEGLVWIRRFRCPGCTVVIRLRPLGYWPRFFYGIETIRSALEHRLSKKCWPPTIRRQVGGHWLRALASGVQRHLGLNTPLFPEGYAGRIDRGWVPVSRSILGVRLPQLC